MSDFVPRLHYSSLVMGRIIKLWLIYAAAYGFLFTAIFIKQVLQSFNIKINS